MANCISSSVISKSALTTFHRASTPKPCHAPVLATPVASLVAFRLPPNCRPVSARAAYRTSWDPMISACGPSDNQRWRGSGQRSYGKWTEQARDSMWFPVDVEENAQEYTFVADVPGLGKNDIKVQVNKNRELSISGERRRRASTASSSSDTSNDVEGQGSESSKASAPTMQRTRQERRFGSFRRTWNLPEDADVSQIRASVDQGVLTLVVNRVQPVEPEVTEIAIN
ncbi:hypothetical protein ABBQ32_006181 [Trebouxia sp. C0010 RCD-2024]